MTQKNKQISVATWNIYNGLPWGFSINSDLKRIDKIIENLDESNLDIIGLQEINNLFFVDILKKKLQYKYEIFLTEKDLLIPHIILFIFLFSLYYFIHNVIGLCLMFIC